MAFTLRPYQQEAVTATINYFRQQHEPALIVLPTGAGKSLVIAELARKARGRVLILAHVKELVAQNHAKYCAYELTADIFAAGLQQKQYQSKVVFGSVQSISRNLSLFDTGFSLLIIDECHRINDDAESQYQQIIQQLQKNNPQLRILGLTATPYRLGKGWIYQYHHYGMVRGDSGCFFRECIYELPLRYMIKHGYLVPPQHLDMPILQYDFSQLRPTDNGLFSNTELNHSLNKQRRITPVIVQQIIEYAQQCRGTMIFAATVEHAKEIYQLLPYNEAALISAETSAIERDLWIQQFKQQQLRYLVNVSVLTTGFDAPHVDLIAILRPTESVSLYQQIIGRGLRLSTGKTRCLILDYAGNPHDIFMPEIGNVKPSQESQPVQVFCPTCGFSNLFWGKCDEQGNVIEHYGRRCQGWHYDEQNKKSQCHFRFRYKSCPHCGAENDIAARRCDHCQQILLDPDDMLKDALRLKGSLVLRCSGMDLHTGIDNKGEWIKATYYDEDGASVTELFRLYTPAQKQRFQYQFLQPHLKAPAIPVSWQNGHDIVAQQHTLLRYPDFIIAKRKGNYWQIRDKIFDYQGRYRRAHELS